MIDFVHDSNRDVFIGLDKWFIIINKNVQMENVVPIDTVFGHVSLDMHLELMKYRSVDGAVVTSLQGSC